MRHLTENFALVCLSLLLLAAVPASGAGNWFRFSLAAPDALYPEYIEDPYAFTTCFRYFKLTDPTLGRPTTVLATDGEKYVQIPFTDDPGEFSSHSLYLQFKGCLNLHLARIELWDAVKLEAGVAGGLNTVFEGFSGTDTLGFDGIWRFSETIKFFDVLAVRFGTHHFSGHWGDEKLEDLPEPGDADYIYYRKLLEYLRNDCWVLGASLTPWPWMRLYAEGEAPQAACYLRPGVHVPAGLIAPYGGDDLATHILSQEGLAGKVSAYDGSYKAYRVQFGGEFRFPIEDSGSLFAAADVQFHQDGQTLHQVGGYDPDNPWESEYTAGFGFEYAKGTGGRKVRVEWTYHSGRFPLLNYFYQRSDYLSFGLTLDN
jgi:hypothetical protein